MNFEPTGGREASDAIRMVRLLCPGPRFERAKWICYFQSLLFALALSCHGALPGFDPYTSDYEKNPPEPSYLVRRSLQEQMRVAQDQYLLRVPIPDAVRPEQELARDSAIPLQVRTSLSARVLAREEGPNQGLWFVAFLLVTGFLVLRKLAPYLLKELNQYFNPWAIVPAGEADVSSNIRDEAQAVADYVAGFKVGGLSANGAGGKTTRVVAEFLLSVPLHIKGLEELLGTVRQETDLPRRQEALSNLCIKMREFKGSAGMPEVLPVWQMASALEGLLKQLAARANSVTPSTLRTLGSGVELLRELCRPGLDPKMASEPPFKLLAVDDEPISRHAVSSSLKKALNAPDLAENGEKALALANRQAYEVVFLDVQMPGMDGFELCSKIRETRLNRSTPVVFVTGTNDFESRANLIPSGGDDLIAKPFLTFEITVKAMTLALRRRLRPSLEATASQPLGAGSSETVRLRKAEVAAATKRQGSLSESASSTNGHSGAVPGEDHLAANVADLSRAQFADLTALTDSLNQGTDLNKQHELVGDLYLGIHSLVPKLEKANSAAGVRLGSALQGLLKKLIENPKHINVSTLQTMTGAVTLLRDLSTTAVKNDLATNPPVRVLVVDDDAISRRALSLAVQLEFGKPDCVEDGDTALLLAKDKPFDVIFLDVLMPGIDGFTLCSRIRETSANRQTPIIFVTGCSDLKARTQSELSGGSELLGKPFLSIEITVKALTFALRSRLQKFRSETLLAPASPDAESNSCEQERRPDNSRQKSAGRTERSRRRALERRRVQARP